MYKKKYGLDKAKGQTYTFACKKAGGKDALEAAVRSGEVTTSTAKNGTVFYVRQEMEAGKETGTNDVKKIGSTSSMDKEMKEIMSKKLASLSWDFPTDKNMHRALEDTSEIPRVVKKKMERACLATEKLVKECEKLCGGLQASKAGGAKVKDLVCKISAAEDASNVLSKMLRLKVAPGGLPLTMPVIVRALGDCADAARPLFDEAQVCKTYAAASKTAKR